jgi:hypothetical protein
MREVLGCREAAESYREAQHDGKPQEGGSPRLHHHTLLH